MDLITSRLRNLVLALVLALYTSASFASGTVDLVGYMQSHIGSGQLDPSVEKYNRLKHFGAWAHQDPAHACYNTRLSVLVRDEDKSVPLQFRPSGCTIASGLWHDPYTATDFTNATDIQVDHVVPLKNAYISGAYAWESSMRCNYANFLANNFHLLAVSGHENMAKGDSGPEGYLPPDHQVRCKYVSYWMKIKAIWSLEATKEEVQAIQDVLKEENCAEEFHTIDEAELEAQHKLAITPIADCEKF